MLGLGCNAVKKLGTARQNEILEIKYIIWVVMSDYSEEEESGSEYSSEEV